MKRPDWRRLLAPFVLNSIVFVALAYLGLWLTGRTLVVRQNGGDQSQSSPIDASPALPAPPLPLIEETEVRNVILIIGDGMGFSQVAAARAELQRLNERLFLERFPVTGWQTTHSLEAVYTDSAASASSLATGHKVSYLTISTSADGRPLRTVLEAARDRGMSTGVVTDSYLWDATPAAFLSHVASRRETFEIAHQMAGSGADLLIGEMLEDFDPGAVVAEDPRPSPLKAFTDAGFRIVRSAIELDAVQAHTRQALLGLFGVGEIAEPASSPNLPELARYAIEKLAGSPNGFFLVVESEEPDTGGHTKDLQRIVRGVRSLDEVAAAAVEQALQDRATLVLITADHETGGMAILHGDAEHRMGVRWATSSHTNEPVPIYAFGASASRFGGVKDNTDIARILSELLGLGLFP